MFFPILSAHSGKKTVPGVGKSFKHGCMGWFNLSYTKKQNFMEVEVTHLVNNVTKRHWLGNGKGQNNWLLACFCLPLF